MTNNTYRFKNTEVHNVLEWWLMNYGYDLLDTENGLYLDDLQDEELSKYTTEEEVVDFFIEQIEYKIEFGEANEFEEDLEILEAYREEIRTPKIIKTTEYFNVSVDDLLETRIPSEYDTAEEELIGKLGDEVVYFDDEEEYEMEREEFIFYPEAKYRKVKCLLKTVNGRIAVVLQDVNRQE